MTKPRVLFVDDEPRILDGLRRSLRGKRTEWEMTFAPDGAAALELLAQAPYDVVVSDMRMPEMNGAELLTHVSERHPEVARVVLSGHIEPESAIQVAVAGHRFLTKPSDVQSVTAVIEELLVRTSATHGINARRIAGAVRAIPALPEQAGETEALLAPDADLSDAVRTAMRDIGLTAKLLQLSNSRFFGSRPRNSSVESLVNAMGVPMVQAVAGAGHLLRPAGPWPPVVQRQLTAAWRHAMATVRLVELVASPANRPHAQAAALLQDVGQLVCLTGARTTHHGVPFRDVGVELLHLWGLPASIVTAVAQRDTPHLPDSTGLGVAGALRTAHLLVEHVESDPAGAHADELARLLAHPQLMAQNVDWHRAAEEASRGAEVWNGPGRR